MKKVGDMKLYSFEELLEEDYGKIGTPERDAFERSVDEAVQAYRVGEAIKQAREAQKLTQAELGEKMGVQRAGKWLYKVINGRTVRRCATTAQNDCDF